MGYPPPPQRRACSHFISTSGKAPLRPPQYSPSILGGGRWDLIDEDEEEDGSEAAMGWSEAEEEGDVEEDLEEEVRTAHQLEPTPSHHPVRVVRHVAWGIDTQAWGMRSVVAAPSDVSLLDNLAGQTTVEQSEVSAITLPRCQPARRVPISSLSSQMAR